MCTFEDTRTVRICDVAIGLVRREADRAFGPQVRYTVVSGEGTRVEASAEVDPKAFAIQMHATIAAAQAALDDAAD